MHRFYLALLVAVALVVSGCSMVGTEDEDDEIIACTTELRPAIEVTVTNARSGASAAADSIGFAIEGDYTDTLRVIGYDEEREPLRIAGAYERAGTYDVRIEKEGFQTWTRKDIKVEENVCHVETVELDAELTPVD